MCQILSIDPKLLLKSTNGSNKKMTMFKYSEEWICEHP